MTVDITGRPGSQDEQELPGEVLAAVVVNYGGAPTCPLNGVLVELAGYHEDQGYFEVQLTAPVKDGRQYDVGDIILAKATELTPVNKASAEYMDEISQAPVEEYDEAVYDLRDALAEIEIYVTGSSISGWTFEQQDRVRSYIKALKEGKVTPRTLKPEVLP